MKTEAWQKCRAFFMIAINLQNNLVLFYNLTTFIFVNEDELKDIEMKTFVKKSIWLTFSDHVGYGNGYVAIPKEHPMNGVHCDSINVDVHGGLTFAEYAKNLDWPELEGVDGDSWVVGFDTAHYGDSLNKWPDEQSVLSEAEYLRDQLTALA